MACVASSITTVENRIELNPLSTQKRRQVTRRRAAAGGSGRGSEGGERNSNNKGGGFPTSFRASEYFSVSRSFLSVCLSLSPSLLTLVSVSPLHQSRFLPAHPSWSPPMARTNASLPAPMQLQTTTSAAWMICRAAAVCAASSTARARRDADWGWALAEEEGFPPDDLLDDGVVFFGDGGDGDSADDCCDTSFTQPFAADDFLTGGLESSRRIRDWGGRGRARRVRTSRRCRGMYASGFF